MDTEEEENVIVAGQDQWVVSVREKLRNPQPENLLQPPCTIYLVPPHIRVCRTDVFEPKVIPIGPYHQVRLTATELKHTCARILIARHLRRHPDITHASLIERCFMGMKELVPRARSCYSDQIYMDNHNDYKYARMLFLDGCSILHMLLKQAENNTQGEEDNSGDHLVMGGNLWIWSLVVYDLLLLENQMPFFVIRRLFELLCTPDDAGVSLVDLALKLFSKLYPPRSAHHPLITEDNVHHLLHLFYLSLLPRWAQDKCDSAAREPEWIPCATELHENGVKFAKKTDGADGFLDVTFRNGTVEIPQLQLYDYQESLFRNLVAFEHYYPDTGTHVTIYATFMNLLLSSPADARLLQRKGILVNQMATNMEGSDFFGRVCEQVNYTSDANYLQNVYVEVNRCYQSRRRKWQARLVQDYCNNPWMIVSIFAASALLLMTVAQTFYAIYSYYHPHN